MTLQSFKTMAVTARESLGFLGNTCSSVLIPTLVLAQAALAKTCEYTQHGLTWSKDELRMNQIQVIGTHNSYHIEAPLEEHDVQFELHSNPIDVWYSFPDFPIQLNDLHVRNLE